MISSDDVARSVLAPGTHAARRVLEIWPDVGSDGVIDRSALGRVVFADPAELRRLEEITHPETRRAIAEEVAAHPEEPVVVEMPILRDWFEEGWIRVVVDAPEDVRVERAVARRADMGEGDVRAVMDRQPSRQKWLLTADYVLDNSGTMEHLAQQCGELWDCLTTDDRD